MKAKIYHRIINYRKLGNLLLLHPKTKFQTLIIAMGHCRLCSRDDDHNASDSHREIVRDCQQSVPYIANIKV